MRHFSPGVFFFFFFSKRGFHTFRGGRPGSCLCARGLADDDSFFWIIHDVSLARGQFVIRRDTVEEHYAGLRS